jgi:hypothetical protein
MLPIIFPTYPLPSHPPPSTPPLSLSHPSPHLPPKTQCCTLPPQALCSLSTHRPLTPVLILKRLSLYIDFDGTAGLLDLLAHASQDSPSTMLCPHSLTPLTPPPSPPSFQAEFYIDSDGTAGLLDLLAHASHDGPSTPGITPAKPQLPSVLERLPQVSSALFSSSQPPPFAPSPHPHILARQSRSCRPYWNGCRRCVEHSPLPASLPFRYLPAFPLITPAKPQVRSAPFSLSQPPLLAPPPPPRPLTLTSSPGKAAAAVRTGEVAAGVCLPPRLPPLRPIPLSPAQPSNSCRPYWNGCPMCVGAFAGVA